MLTVQQIIDELNSWKKDPEIKDLHARAAQKDPHSVVYCSLQHRYNARAEHLQSQIFDRLIKEDTEYHLIRVYHYFGGPYKRPSRHEVPYLVMDVTDLHIEATQPEDIANFPDTEEHYMYFDRLIGIPIIWANDMFYQVRKADVARINKMYDKDGEPINKDQ